MTFYVPGAVLSVSGVALCNIHITRESTAISMEQVKKWKLNKVR